MKAKTKTLLSAAVVAGAAFGAFADFEINVDLAKKDVLKDVRQSTCGPIIGYAGCKGWAPDWWIFGENRDETAQALLDCGAWFERMWEANEWFANRNKLGKDGRPKSDPDAAFKLWQQNGIKVLFTLEAWGWEKGGDDSIMDFCRYIASNRYESVVAGFELGNEPYSHSIPKMQQLGANWCKLVPQIKKVLPKVHLGLPIAEYIENDPDVKQIRNRMLNDPENKVKRTSYFSAGELNKQSAAYILAVQPVLDKISHMIYHCYGAETPYSCSYYGYRRLRNFEEAFPEIKGKKWWLSEIRMRSDEDNRCHRMYREALIMAHYSLMTIVQPEVDGFNLHQLYAISGGLYQSGGKSWSIQWRDAGGDLPDYRAPFGRRRLDIGAMGAMYRILTEGIKGHPLFLSHGTSKAQDEEDAFYASARFTDQVYAHRRSLKEGNGPKPVDGEVEYVAAADARRSELCLLMVNSKPTAEKVVVKVAGRQFAAPTYRTLSCPERFLDCCEVPGDDKPWRTLSWEETQSGYYVVPMERNEGMKPKCDTLTVEIGPHTVQTVTVLTRPAPQAK